MRRQTVCVRGKYPAKKVVCVKLCKKVVWYLVDPYALSVTRRA